MERPRWRGCCCYLERDTNHAQTQMPDTTPCDREGRQGEQGLWHHQQRGGTAAFCRRLCLSARRHSTSRNDKKRFLHGQQRQYHRRDGGGDGRGRRADGVQRVRLRRPRRADEAEVARRGVVDVLRKGVKAYPGSFFLFAPTPSAKNAAAPRR